MKVDEFVANVVMIPRPLYERAIAGQLDPAQFVEAVRAWVPALNPTSTATATKQESTPPDPVAPAEPDKELGGIDEEELDALLDEIAERFPASELPGLPSLLQLYERAGSRAMISDLLDCCEEYEADSGKSIRSVMAFCIMLLRARTKREIELTARLWRKTRESKGGKVGVVQDARLKAIQLARELQEARGE